METRRTRPSPGSPALALAAALLMGLAACDSTTAPADDPPPGDPTPELTTFSIYLTDAPGDVADVWVAIQDVRLVGQGSPRSLLTEPTDLINLLDLEDTAMLLVEEAEVDPGVYSQLRFVIDGAVLETVGGDVFTSGGSEHPLGLPTTGQLLCPSCGQSGLKVNFAGGLELHEGRNAVLVDFDVSQSFGRQAGQSGRWVMRPVIQGVVVDPDDVTAPSGTILGEVVLATDSEGEPIQIPPCGGADRDLGDFVPLATATTLLDDEGTPFTFLGTTGADGAFTLEVLDGDVYEMGYWDVVVLEDAELQWEAQVTPSEVEVPAGGTVEGVVYMVTAVSCEPAG